EVEWRSGAAGFTLAWREVERGDGARAAVSGFAAARVRLTGTPAELGYGAAVVLRGRLETPSESRNPGGFDNRAYLARNGVYATLTARRPNDWNADAPGGLAGPTGLALRLRDAALRRIGALLPPVEAGLLAGILL